MTAQETKLLNAFETTLNATAGASDLTFTVSSVVDGASNTLTAPCYLVLNPDSATNREVILVTSINAGTKTLTCDNINKRFLTGSAATSGLSHSSGAVVRVSPVQQHIEDINDRVDTIINEAGTAVNTSLFLDEDDMSSNSDTKGVTQQSVKTYVDTQLTAEDLDVTADSGGPISIDLDSEVLDIAGGTGITTSASVDTITIDIDSTVATLTGTQTLTNKTIDVDSNTVSNIEVDNLKSGVLDTDLSSTAGTDTTIPSAKAVKTYVDTQITAEDLDLADGDGNTGAVDLDSQSLILQGTANKVDVGLSGQTFTIGLPATITANVNGNVSGTSGSTTGNAATATTLQTARAIAGNNFDGSAPITIAAGDLSDVSTSGVSNEQVLVYNSTSSQFEPGSVGSATALIDGDSDFTLTDGIANGIHYELDNTDMADWNQAGIALTTAGGIFTHHQTQAATYTVAANTGSVMAGPITITGTVTNNGTLVVI